MVSCQAFSNCWLYYFYMIESIKKRLVQEIKNSNLTTIEISKRVGVSSEMITQYCTTKKMPSIETFAKLCEVLDVSADYILGLKEY